MLSNLDEFVDRKMSIVDVPKEFQPVINVVYPAANFVEFERWFDLNYEGCNTDRIYLPIYFCGYQVNHNYGQDKEAMNRLQSFVDSLSNGVKYFCISQYDNGVGVDWKGKDVLEFNMSKVGQNKYPLPLIGQPYPYKFNSEKKYLANFIGSMTHKIREHAKILQGKEGYYISFEPHTPYEYCKIISESVFTLCYRGYGLNSFRIAEALQYGSIPVYISDEFIIPHNTKFELYGIKIPIDLISETDDILRSHQDYEVVGNAYHNLYTYEGTRYKILKHLLTLK